MPEKLLTACHGFAAKAIYGWSRRNYSFSMPVFTTAWQHKLRSHPLLEIALIFAFWFVGQSVVRWSRLPLPGGIVGMLLLIALLSSGLLKPTSLRRGANWFITEMLLFFVPAVLAILDHREFLGLVGLKILAAVVLGTIAVMVITALCVELCFRILYSEPHAGD